jgi:hypothetical protein
MYMKKFQNILITQWAKYWSIFWANSQSTRIDSSACHMANYFCIIEINVKIIVLFSRVSILTLGLEVCP